MVKKSLLFGLAFILLISMVSAEIMISQPDSLYNFGDTLDVELEVSDFQEGYFDVDLKCSNSSSNLYHGILSKKIIRISRELTPLYVGNVSGNCNIKAKYGGDTTTSQNFEISRNIIVELDIEELNYKAGDSIIVKGSAEKENNELVTNGFVEIQLGEDIKATDSVENGRFTINFSTQEDMKSGSYNLLVKVYEKDSNGDVLNIGKSKATLSISQQPDSIEIAMIKQIVNPGEKIEILILLKDKSDSTMPGEVVIRLEDSLGEIIYEGLAYSDEEVEIEIKEDHEPGYSKIICEKEDILGEKIFEVTELEKVSVEVDENTLTITNIGNIDYEKAIEVDIGGKTRLLDLSLEKGETKVYGLSAPNGEYEIIVSDGSNILHQDEGVALTGNAISITEVKDKLSVWVKYSIAWIFIVLVLGLTLFVMYRNNSKKSSYSFPVERTGKKDENKEKNIVENKQEGQSAVLVQEPKKENIVKQNKQITKAEQVLVLNGEKQNAGIVAIKIKNKITPEANKNFIQALKKAYSLKGAASVTKGYVILVFSPSLSKTFKNEESSIKAALEVDKSLKEMNKKFKDKIEYSIGVNAGEIISKVEGDVLKFTSIGPTVNLAKKIADIADLSNSGEVLISKESKEKSAPNVKVNKVEDIKEAELFKVERIVNQEKNKEFIQDFLKRNKSK